MRTQVCTAALAISLLSGSLEAQIGQNDQVKPRAAFDVISPGNSFIYALPPTDPSYWVLYAYDGTDAVRYILDVRPASKLLTGGVGAYVHFQQPVGPLFGGLHEIVKDAGVRWRNAAGVVEDLAPPSANVAMPQGVPDGAGGYEAVEFEYDDDGDGQMDRVHRYSIEGTALKIEIQDTDLGQGDVPANEYYAGYHPGTSGPLLQVADLDVPYCPWPVGRFLDSVPGWTRTLFFGSYVDLFRSSSLHVEPYRNPLVPGALGVGTLAENVPDYDPGGTPSVPVLDETIYVVANPDLVDLLPDTNVARSAERDQLDDQVVYDMWSQKVHFEENAGVEIAWTSPASGTAVVSGTATIGEVVSGELALDCAGSAEVRLMAYVRSGGAMQLVSDQRLAPAGLFAPFSIGGAVGLAAGDELVFRISGNGFHACEEMQFGPVITWTESGSSTPVVHDLTSDYPAVGSTSWSFREYTGATLRDLVAAPGTPFQYHATVDGTPLGPQPVLSLESTGGANPISYVFVDPPFFPTHASTQMYRRLKDAGFDDIAVIDHAWHQHGYDVCMPDVYPEGPYLGTGDEWDEMLVTTIRDLGYLFSVHESYVWLADPPGQGTTCTAPWSTDPLLIALDSDGNQKTVGGVPAMSVHESPGAQSIVGTAIASDYQANLAYLDALTSLDPEMNTDLRDGSPAKTNRDAYQWRKQLLFDIRHTPGAPLSARPLLGEGGDTTQTMNEIFLGGYVDGTERQIRGRRFSPTLPDFELNVVRPKMANHGMGYYGRYFAMTNGGSGGGQMQELEFDRYRAQSLLYGHAAFLGDAYEPEKSRRAELGELMALDAHTYFMSRGVQSLLLDADAAATVSYWTPGVSVPVDFSGLMAQTGAGVGVQDVRIGVTYDNGLDVYGNFMANETSSWSVSDYTSVQGHNGWRYYTYDQAGAGPLEEMDFQPDNDRYRGDAGGTASFLERKGGTLKNLDAELVWEYTVPTAGDWSVTAFAHMSTAQGPTEDGVRVAITTSSQTSPVWTTVTGAALDQLVLTEALNGAQANDWIRVHVDAGSVISAGGNDDFYLHVGVERALTSEGATWNVDLDGEAIALPLYGTAFTNGVDVRGFSGTPAGGDRVDFMECAEYRFLRSRSGTSSYDGITTDGAVALVERTLPQIGAVQDVHLFQGTVAQENGAVIASMTGGAAPCTGGGWVGSLQIVHDLEEMAIRILPQYFECGVTADVTYGRVPFSQVTVTVEDPTDPSGAVVLSPTAYTFDDATDTLTIPGARMGWIYRVLP